MVETIVLVAYCADKRLEGLYSSPGQGMRGGGGGGSGGGGGVSWARCTHSQGHREMEEGWCSARILVFIPSGPPAHEMILHMEGMPFLLN